MLKLGRFLKPYKWYTLFGSIFKFLEVIAELLLPMLMVNIINVGIANQDKGYILRYSLLMLAMSILGYGFAFTCQYFAARASQGFGTTLRNEVYKHIMEMEFKDLDKIGTQPLTVRITNDITQLQVGVAMLIRLVSRAPFICIGSLIMAFILNYKLALILLMTIPALSVIIYIIVNKTSKLYTNFQKRIDRISEGVKEALSGVRVIRSFSKSLYEDNKLKSENKMVSDEGIRIGKISSLFNPLTSLVINLITIIILWVSGIEIKSGSMSQGEIVAFINYVTQILGAILVLSNLVILITRSQVSASRVNEILDCEPANQNLNGHTTEEILDEVIKFDNVSFRYTDNAENVLSDITFNIKKNETIGIIGRTGSGKSTLIQLIPKYYEINEGQIKYNEKDINDYSLSDLRNRIRIVFQKSTLFSGTIYDNLTMGLDNVKNEDILEAIQIAQATEIIRDENDLSKYIERDGTNLSGGQRQRISMARALVTRPEVLIFDDTTSALDYLTEANFRKALAKVTWLKTTIIVSQRISSIIKADKIIVLEEGRIVGFDTHEKLLDSCDIYKELFNSQVNGGKND